MTEWQSSAGSPILAAAYANSGGVAVGSFRAYNQGGQYLDAYYTTMTGRLHLRASTNVSSATGLWLVPPDNTYPAGIFVDTQDVDTQAGYDARSGIAVWASPGGYGSSGLASAYGKPSVAAGGGSGPLAPGSWPRTWDRIVSAYSADTGATAPVGRLVLATDAFGYAAAPTGDTGSMAFYTGMYAGHRTDADGLAMTINPNHRVTIGQTNEPEGQLQVEAQGSTTVGLVVKGAVGQTADLTRWRDGAGAVLAVVDKSGNVGIGIATPETALHLGTGALKIGARVIADANGSYYAP
ncbi:MAG: hypothetical protein HY331_11580 [Chloroflexi bacterium]|nr:hypothetical protein [Chloroflexota bacterium]